MPRYGFNVQWMFSKGRQSAPLPADERMLDVIAGWGFDFVRVPCDYRFLLTDSEGYALWNFEGPFGIIGRHRPGATFEQLDGYLVDRQWLDVLLSHRSKRVST